MPTLRQIDVRLRTQESLSSLKRKRASSSVDNGGGKDDMNIHDDDDEATSPPAPTPSSSSATTTTVAAPSSSASSSSFSFFGTILSIRTPSALLSRDPSQLATTVGTTLENIKEVRAEVAAGIICDPRVGHGRDADSLVAEVAEYCIVVDDDDDNDNDGNNDIIGSGNGNGNGSSDFGENDKGDGIPPARGHDRITRPRPLMPGAMTALDMCARALLLKNITNTRRSNSNDNGAGGFFKVRRLGSIGTGNTAIDRLLAPDDAYSKFDDGWSMPLPYKIPNNDNDNDNNDQHGIMNKDNSSRDMRRGGVPFGMVTEFAGPPSSGKTQLALGVAARAAFENGMKVHYVSGGNSRKALSRRLYTMCLELAHDDSVTTENSQRMRCERSGIDDRRRTEEAKSMALRALDRVAVASVPDAYSLLATLARIDEEMTAHRDTSDCTKSSIDNVDNNNGTLLIVDSVSGCLSHHLSGERAGPALANQVALTLRRMARTHDGRLGHDTATTMTTMNQGQERSIGTRRFAVVVTNGTVAKRSAENNNNESPGITSGITTAMGGKPMQKHKPAMGRYWHVSDVGIWLEEDAFGREGTTSQPTINKFYDDTPVVGLSLTDKKVVCAMLQNHYGKSCKDRGNGQTMCKFRIRSGGIADV